MTKTGTNNILAEIQGIIAICDPQKTAMRFRTKGKCQNEGLFRFCQHLKQFKEYVIIEQVLPFVRLWFEHWQNSILVDENGNQSKFEDKFTIEEIELMAEELWPNIKYGVGGELTAAIENAKRRYDETIPELGNYGGEKERVLALVCFELQQAQPMEKDKTFRKPFYLSGYKAAVVMGLDEVNGQKKGRLVLGVFARKGIIRLVKTGNRNNASEYLFTGSPPIYDYKP